MKMNEQCFPCLENRINTLSYISNDEDMFEHVLNRIHNKKINTEFLGETIYSIAETSHNNDPYHDIKILYDIIFLHYYDLLDKNILSFEDAIKYAIIGNIIDYNPMKENVMKEIREYFDSIDQLSLAINHIDYLVRDIKKSNSLLYLSGNCGEIVLDKLLIKRIKQLNPRIQIYFAVKGHSVVNSCTVDDAKFINMDDYATIISNGDSSVGTIINRTSDEFQRIYNNVDIIISKGQANFECLNEYDKNIYFLLMTKCDVISNYIGVEKKSLVCLNMQLIER
jgi:hypothetical protein